MLKSRILMNENKTKVITKLLLKLILLSSVAGIMDLVGIKP
jgi:hypothetical protein